MVEAIRSSTSVERMLPVESQWVPPIKKLKRREPTLRDLDTINSDAMKITQFNNMIWDTIKGDISSPAIEKSKISGKSKVEHRPRLELPAEAADRDLHQFTQEMDEVMDRVQQVNAEAGDQSIKEQINRNAVAIFKLMIQSYKVYRSQHEESTTLLFKNVQEREIHQKQLREDYFSKQGKAEKLKKAATIAGWVNRVFTVGLVVGGIAATVATGGAALPATFFLGSAAAGSAGITEGILHYLGSKKEGEVGQLRLDREMVGHKLKEDVTKLNVSFDAVLQTWHELQAIMQSRNEAMLQEARFGR